MRQPHPEDHGQMHFAQLLSRALERRSAERRLFDRRQDPLGIDFPERRMGPRRAAQADRRAS